MLGRLGCCSLCVEGRSIRRFSMAASFGFYVKESFTVYGGWACNSEGCLFLRWN